MTDVMSFMRGGTICHITSAHDGAGFIGLCDGKVVGAASTRAAVMRMIIKSPVTWWRELSGESSQEVRNSASGIA